MNNIRNQQDQSQGYLQDLCEVRSEIYDSFFLTHLQKKYSWVQRQENRHSLYDGRVPPLAFPSFAIFGFQFGRYLLGLAGGGAFKT